MKNTKFIIFSICTSLLILPGCSKASTDLNTSTKGGTPAIATESSSSTENQATESAQPTTPTLNQTATSTPKQTPKKTSGQTQTKSPTKTPSQTKTSPPATPTATPRIPDPATDLKWENQTISVYKPSSGGVWYPRVFELNNGDLICGFDTNEGTSNAVIKTVTSSDGGLTWSKTAVTASKFSQYKCANAAFYQHKNGELWVAYRANQNVNNQLYTSIRISKSTDNGKTWAEHSIVAEETGTGGVYEPIFVEIGNELAIFYANDSLNVVSSGDHQNIEYKVWKNGKWSDKYIASNGNSTRSRDGMPAVARLSNGNYLLAIESTAMRSQYPFILKLKSSSDGYNWGSLKTIYMPSKTGRKAAAPYLLQLPDGRVVISFQTDEDMSQAGDKYSEMKLMISTDASCTKFSKAFAPFNTPEGYNSIWNGISLYKNQYLLAVSSTNYPSSQIVLRRAGLK
jgi:hypothetical protein